MVRKSQIKGCRELNSRFIRIWIAKAAAQNNAAKNRDRCHTHEILRELNRIADIQRTAATAIFSKTARNWNNRRPLRHCKELEYMPTIEYAYLCKQGQTHDGFLAHFRALLWLQLAFVKIVVNLFPC